jgi:hypothetical protein
MQISSLGHVQRALESNIINPAGLFSGVVFAEPLIHGGALRVESS